MTIEVRQWVADKRRDSDRYKPLRCSVCQQTVEFDYNRDFEEIPEHIKKHIDSAKRKFRLKHRECGKRANEGLLNYLPSERDVKFYPFPEDVPGGWLKIGGLILYFTIKALRIAKIGQKNEQIFYYEFKD